MALGQGMMCRTWQAEFGCIGNGRTQMICPMTLAVEQQKRVLTAEHRQEKDFIVSSTGCSSTALMRDER
jgi:hypothetical protein